MRKKISPSDFAGLRPMAFGLLVAILSVSPASAQITEKKPGTIAVSATGKATVAPDMAVINLAVVREAETARAALSANNEAMTSVLASLKETGIEDRDLQTSNINIQPKYLYPARPKRDGTQKPPQIVGYTVSNALTVRVRDLNKVGDILDRTVTLGVNSGGGISFRNDDPKAVIEQARKLAMEAAIGKAKVLTGAAGVKLGRILEISEQGGFQPRPRAMARAEAAFDGGSSVPVAAGENNYQVTVNVRWEIDQ